MSAFVEFENNQKELINKTAECLSEMQKGNVDSFDRLYFLTNKHVQWAVKMHLKDQNDLEDVIQEVYLTVYRKCGTLKDPQSGLKWIKTIAFNKANDRNRRNYRPDIGTIEETYDELDSVIDSSAEDSIPIPEDIMINQESRDIVRQVICDLKDVQKDVIICHYYNDMKTKEIAEALSIPEGTVKTALSRGRNEIKKKLTDYEKKGLFKLLAVPGAVAFLAFAHMDAEAMAAELPDMQNILHEEAVKITKEAGNIASKGATLGGKAATTSGFAASKIVPIVIAAVVAAGAIVGGVYAHNKKKESPTPPVIKEELTAQAEPVQEESASKALSQEELYGLYLDKLTEIQNEYAPGQDFYVEGDVITPDVANGVVFAKLIDFNNDGTNELVAVYTDGSMDEYGECNNYLLDIWAQEENEIQKVYGGRPSNGYFSAFLSTVEENDEIFLVTGDEPHDGGIQGCVIKENRFDGNSFQEIHQYGYPDNKSHPIIDENEVSYEEATQAFFARLGLVDDPNVTAIRYNIANAWAEDWMFERYACVDQNSLTNLQQTLLELGYGSSTAMNDDNDNSNTGSSENADLQEVTEKLNGLWAENEGWPYPILVYFDDNYAYYYEPVIDDNLNVHYKEPRKTSVTLKKYPSNPLRIIDVDAGETVELQQTDENGNSPSGTVILIDNQPTYWFPDEQTAGDEGEMIEAYLDGEYYAGNCLWNDVTKGYTAEEYIDELYKSIE